jgi:tryptophan-rich sensory protein
MAAKTFLATGAATATAAVVGSVATDVDSAWYRSLELPDWQPPGQVIGQVWTVLYTLIAGATGRAWTRADRAQRRRLAAALGINLALNAAWPWVFFRGHRPALGVAVIGALEASTIALTREVARADRKAAVALVPYLGWNTFALVLNARIAAVNQDGRGR